MPCPKMSAVGKSEPAASSLDAYLHSCQNDRVCLLFGLRRTGKTTMLRQAVLDMAPENAAKTAYIKATVLDTIAALNRDMKRPRAGELNFDDDSVNAEDAGGYCTAGDDESGGQTPTGIQAAVRGRSV